MSHVRQQIAVQNEPPKADLAVQNEPRRLKKTLINILLSGSYNRTPFAKSNKEKETRFFSF